MDFDDFSMQMYDHIISAMFIIGCAIGGLQKSGPAMTPFTCSDIYFALVPCHTLGA